MSGRLLDDCFADPGRRLRHDEALELLRERVGAVVDAETVRLAEAPSRILAEDVRAPAAVPAFSNAAVDGFAFAHADLEPTGGFMPVTQRIAAGHPPLAPLAGFSAARIFTGAAMPEGADTVAMQEDCETHEQDGRPFVIVPQGLKPGANRRLAGEDLQAGDTIARAGERLRPQEVAALASIGAAEVSVFRRLRVALLSSGDEIRRPGEGLPPGGVYDSNHFLLSALLSTLGASILDLGIVADDRPSVEAALARASGAADAVLTTGGASKGEEDHMAAALSRLGRRHLWQLAVKPGRPMLFGQVGDTAVLGLPGNPVAAFVCFLLYARPLLLTLGGGRWSEPDRFPLPARFRMEKKPGRREFLRGRLVRDGGGLSVDRFPRDGSGIVTSLREADGLIELPEEVERVEKGDAVAFLPFAAFGL